MPEIAPNEPFPQGLPVALQDNRLGRAITDEGALFNLANLFGNAAKYLGNDKFSEVYFRTESGNIYRLDDTGLLIDSNLSRQKHSIQTYDLPIKELLLTHLQVGEPFRYARTGQTTKITEIIATSKKQHDPAYLKMTTGQRINTIVDDFQKNLPAGVEIP